MVTKTFLVIALCMLAGCGASHQRATDNYDSIREFAKTAKKQEDSSFKVTIAQETAVHKAEQAKYNDMIKNPGKYADVVDLSTGQNIEVPQEPHIPGKFNDNTPESFQIAPGGKKFLVPDKGVCH